MDNDKVKDVETNKDTEIELPEMKGPDRGQDIMVEPSPVPDAASEPEAGAKPKPRVRKPSINRPPVTSANIRELTRQALDVQPKIKVMIPVTESDKDDVPISINGYTYLVKRGHWVDLPRDVVEVLRNAVYTIYTQKRREGEGAEGMELIPEEVPAIPFQTK